MYIVQCSVYRPTVDVAIAIVFTRRVSLNSLYGVYGKSSTTTIVSSWMNRMLVVENTAF